MPKSNRVCNSSPLQEWAHQPGNLGGPQSPRRGQKGCWWGQMRSHALLALVKAQAGLLLSPPPSTVVGFQDTATHPRPPFTGPQKSPCLGSSMEPQHCCNAANSSSPTPASGLGPLRLSQIQALTWGLLGLWASIGLGTAEQTGQSGRWAITGRVTGAMYVLPLTWVWNFLATAKISMPATPEKRLQPPGGFPGGGQSLAVCQETERRETSSAQAPELSLSLYPHMKEKSSLHEPQRHGVRLLSGNPQSYNFVQRGRIKPQFLSLENGAGAYFRVPSGGLRRQEVLNNWQPYYSKESG